MDMSPSSNTNITNFPLSDPHCNNDACAAFKAAHTASQNQISWASQFLYGHYVTWYYLAVIGVGMLLYGYKLSKNLYAPLSTNNSKPAALRHKVLALVRSVTYRRIHGRIGDTLGLPGLGIILFLLFTCVYLLLLTFIQRPYYRQRRGFGSPPLAIRTGLMAIAQTPIIVALAGKVNVVSVLTGVSHEKLNVLHRYTSYMCLFLSIVHTVPFIVAPLREGGAKQLRKQYYKKGGYEFTGTPPLGMLVGLCALSIPWFRRIAYNLFYRLHILLWVAYLGLMFWHAGQALDSWAYLWATLAMYIASILGRLFVKWQTFSVFRSGTWYRGFPAQAVTLPGGMTKLNVYAPAEFVWAPGQHCWLRMLHLSLFQNHPFTIASLPCSQHDALDGEKTKGLDVQRMTFYIRSYAGLTRRLEEGASTPKKNDPEKIDYERFFSVHVDGPYGGVVEDIPKLYDCAVFVAGGAGVSACLPWMLHIARRMRSASYTTHPGYSNRGDDSTKDQVQNKAESVSSSSKQKSKGKNGPSSHNPTTRTTKIHLIWMVRHADHLQWIASELAQVIRLAGRERVQFEFYITGNKQEADTLSASATANALVGEAASHVDPQQSPSLEFHSPTSLNAALHNQQSEAMNTLELADESGKDNGHRNTLDPITSPQAAHKHARKSSAANVISNLGRIYPERPYLLDLIAGVLNGHRRVMIYGCGPESLKIDLSNTAAKAQTRVLRGEADKISLHTETFGW